MTEGKEKRRKAKEKNNAKKSMGKREKEKKNPILQLDGSQRDSIAWDSFVGQTFIVIPSRNERM